MTPIAGWPGSSRTLEHTTGESCGNVRRVELANSRLCSGRSDFASTATCSSIHFAYLPSSIRIITASLGGPINTGSSFVVFANKRCPLGEILLLEESVAEIRRLPKVSTLITLAKDCPLHSWFVSNGNYSNKHIRILRLVIFGSLDES